MITGKLAWSQLLAAVLAAVLVSSIDVLARKLDVPLSEPNEAKQPHDGGHAQTVAHRMYFAIRFFEHLDLLEENQFQCPFPVDHIQWLKRGIEQKDLTEGVHSFAEAASVIPVNLDQKPGSINVFAKVGPKPVPNAPPLSGRSAEGGEKIDCFENVFR